MWRNAVNFSNLRIEHRMSLFSDLNGIDIYTGHYLIISPSTANILHSKSASAVRSFGICSTEVA